jgi:hypothetical protein
MESAMTDQQIVGHDDWSASRERLREEFSRESTYARGLFDLLPGGVGESPLTAKTPSCCASR